MHYLIDGHNLIGKMSDINLDDPDDEVKLILRLRSWAARGRKRKVTVIFDRGLPGGEDRGLSSGQVKVVFSSAGRTADTLLINRINKAKNPAEFTLVSSDQTITQLAERRRMIVLRSEQFAGRMDQERKNSKASRDVNTVADPQLNKDEIEMWLKMFAEDQNGSHGH